MNKFEVIVSVTIPVHAVTTYSIALCTVFHSTVCQTRQTRQLRLQLVWRLDFQKRFMGQATHFSSDFTLSTLGSHHSGISRLAFESYRRDIDISSDVI